MVLNKEQFDALVTSVTENIKSVIAENNSLCEQKVKEAEAEAQAAEFNKRAAIAKAEGEAEAAKIEADATAYKNLKVAQNLSVMQAQWKHEEEMARLEKWDGIQVSSQSIYVPNTYDLKSGK